jgi:hypothetical protein
MHFVSGGIAIDSPTLQGREQREVTSDILREVEKRHRGTRSLVQAY